MNQILIVDDEAFIRDLLKRHLLKQGYEVLTAKDGMEGLAVFREHKPPVTLLDLKMPKMDGIQFLKELPAQVFEAHAIIVLTGHGGDVEKEICYNMGIQAFLSKPVDLLDLNGLIKRSFDLIRITTEFKQLNQRQNNLLQNIPDLIWEINPHLEFIYLSKNVEQILGYPPEELIGTAISDYIADEDLTQFFFRFQKNMSQLTPEIRGVTLKFKTRSGELLPMQISANCVYDEQGNPKEMIGINRDVSAWAMLEKDVESLAEEMEIHVDQKIRLVFAHESLRQYMPQEWDLKNEPPDFLSLLEDPSLSSLFPFAFDQKENFPFPILVRFFDDRGKEHLFSTKLAYDAERNILVGKLVPQEKAVQFALVEKKMKKQEESLKSAVIVDPAMQQSILKDSNNLADEILVLVKALSSYAYLEENVFNFEEFKQFVFGKDMFIYHENLRLLGNKVHGFKGTSGFVIPEAKHLCHKMEDITRPLAQNQLVLTASIVVLLKQFIFKAQEMLEAYQKDPDTEFDVSDWIAKIDNTLQKGQAYLGAQLQAFETLITQRSTDHGEVRKRAHEEYLSVSLGGYEQLSQQVKNLYYTLTEGLSQELLLEASDLYNEFIDTHQHIKKVPLDLSRYERLIPSLAQQYTKEADFIYIDHRVCADREFWNAIHEILNHTLKNAVIHGLEIPDERKRLGKNCIGKITVEVWEDALHIFVRVSDDGRGIDVEKIIEKAAENNLYTQEQLKAMSYQEVLHLVFIQGISTAEALDDNAGRGVGLNAVQEAMKQFNGTCQIESEVGKGCSWNFNFSKNNVSLPCFIVTIDQLKIAIPEDRVESFHEYNPKNLLQIDQKPAYRHLDKALFILNSNKFFGTDISRKAGDIPSILIIKVEGETMGVVINNILHYATMPILPLPQTYGNMPIYIGITFLGSEPVVVLNPDALF
ncbi:response regulator [Deltaproteobacteria bacterium TL4]